MITTNNSKTPLLYSIHRWNSQVVVVLKGKTFSHSPRGRQNHLSPHCQSGSAPCRRPQSPAENSGKPNDKDAGELLRFFSNNSWVSENPGYSIHIWKGKLPSRERIHIPPWEKENYRSGRDMLVPRRVLFLEIIPCLHWTVTMRGRV